MNATIDTEPLSPEHAEIMAREVFANFSADGLRLSKSVEVTFRLLDSAEIGTPHKVVEIGWRYRAAEGVYDDNLPTILNGPAIDDGRKVQQAATALARQAMSVLVMLATAKLGYNVTSKIAKVERVSTIHIAS